MRPGCALPPWLAVLLARALATAVVLATGFSAVSDDDFARLVIAQEFVQKPSFDPSGTSWLPFPFWLTGSALAAFGGSVLVARLLALGTSLGSALLVYVAARWVGIAKGPAWLGACVAAILPHAVWLGAATIPDGYSAALCLLSLASLCNLDVKKRWLGALAITCASLSRYEAWPIAACFAGCGLFDAFVQQRRSWLLPSLCALLGPATWLVYGGLHHGDTLFFVERVADYRRSLGRSTVDLLHGLIGYPRVLLRAEPELVFSCLSCLLAVGRRALPRRAGRLLMGAFVVLAFLVAGDLGDGAPTHHPERPLLVVWLVACVCLGWALCVIAKERRWLAAVGAVVVIAFALRPIMTRRDGFIDRSDEITIGQQSRALVGTGELLIDTDDYAFFAIMAGFERVSQARALRLHDPRQAQANPWSSREQLEQRLRREGAPWLIASKDKRDALRGLGQSALESQRYALFRLSGPSMKSP